MGSAEHTIEEDRSARGRRLGWRPCLRKGCQNRYQARQYNQRYCQDPECLRELLRWQGAKRQRKRRASPEGRQTHARAERERRERKKSQASSSNKNSSSSPLCERARGHAGGHAGKKFQDRSVIGPGVMSLREILLAPPPTTATMSAARPCGAYTTVNASGGRARRKPVA